MTLPLYLAMTAMEMSGYSDSIPHCAYMACHFSPYTTGLSNIPATLPESTMLIINDRIPIHGHDAGRITDQLMELCHHLPIDSLLLDLQRTPDPESMSIVDMIVNNISLPLAVTEPYANNFDCAVFLSAHPFHMPLEEYIEPWLQRKIWLEVAAEYGQYIITEEGSSYYPIKTMPAETLCPQLHCHYSLKKEDRRLCISLERRVSDISTLLQHAMTLPIDRAVGLCQQLSGINYQTI